MLWLAGSDDRYEIAALASLEKAGVSHKRLSPMEASRIYPQINFEGVSWAIQEEEAGYLLARRACELVAREFVDLGGSYLEASAAPGAIEGGRMDPVLLADGSQLRADKYVFAVGPWLGKCFPSIGDMVASTRQEVYFFGTPAGDDRFSDGRLPVWLDNRGPVFYGVPGNERRGMKIGDDTRGPLFDPGAGDRTPSIDGIRAARAYLEFRFPGMKNAPLLESRVCQYENTPDHYFILDRHPEAANVWIAGGGSGHGFKHGPAFGDLAARVVLKEEQPDARFSLKRRGRQNRMNRYLD
jgi:glycine/D-amino acid oxidase-like deaminating enzyme